MIIAGAGKGSAALAGSLAAHTTLPVIGVPLRGEHRMAWMPLLSTVMMPSGIPVACVAIDGAKNAAYLAAEILALSDEDLAKKLSDYKEEMKQGVLKKDAALQEKPANSEGEGENTQDQIYEECGIFGIYDKNGKDDGQGDAYYALYALQH